MNTRVIRYTTLPAPSDSWAAYVDSDHQSQVSVTPRVLKLLGELEAITKKPAARWLHRMAFAHVHGRYRLEQVHSRREVSVDLRSDGTARLPTALVFDLQELADRHNSTASHYLAESLEELLSALPMIDPETFSDDWNEDRNSMKVRLPESLLGVVTALQSALTMSRSDVLRNIFFLHLSGRVGYETAVSAGTWRARRKDSDDGPDVMFSFDVSPSDSITPRTDFIRRHGKSSEDIRFFLPTPMKSALLIEAAEADLAASTYARRVVMQDLLGAKGVIEGVAKFRP